MKQKPYLSEQSKLSANPGVSTTVSFSFTPLSSISTEDVSILRVLLMRSKKNENLQNILCNYHSQERVDGVIESIESLRKRKV